MTRFEGAAAMLPAFIDDLPALAIPFPEDAVSTRALRSDQGLVVFFTFHKDVVLPEHAHGPQWGTLIAGTLTITIGGEIRTMHPGDHWDIPDGVPHSVHIAAGSRAIDVFAEQDRHPLRGEAARDHR
jgi:quercetin dioxygenase-like cupin family protein